MQTAIEEAPTADRNRGFVGLTAGFLCPLPPLYQKWGPRGNRWNGSDTACQRRRRGGCIKLRFRWRAPRAFTTLPPLDGHSTRRCIVETIRRDGLLMVEQRRFGIDARLWGGGGPFGTKCAGARRILRHFRQMWFRLCMGSCSFPGSAGVGFNPSGTILADGRLNGKVARLAHLDRLTPEIL